MKKFLCSILILTMLFSFCCCGQTESTSCNHQYEASVSGNTVTLKCKLCGSTAAADVELPKETVEVEKEVEKIVEKEVVKTVFQEKKVEVPVYLSDEERMEAEDYELLNYYKENYGKIDEIKNIIVDNYYKKVDAKDIMEGAYTGMVEALDDQYCAYTPAVESEEYNNNLSRAYSGIGVTISADENNNAVIIDLFHGSPAEDAGLEPNDIIAKVDDVDMLGKGIDAAASAIRGEIGTYVRVEIIRGQQHYTYVVMRRQIATTTVDYGVFPSGVGYIGIAGFNASTPYEVNVALIDLEYYGCTKCIIDLRDNGGGMVESALYVADMLMDKGVMAYLEDQAGNKDYYNTYDGRTPMEYAVLCNENSASASEMLLAGIQDNKEGIIVGTKTYGKGIVQVLRTLSDGSSLNITQYQYFSPNGTAIHENGITPDYEAELTAECFDEEGNQIDDTQILKALELLGVELD